MGGGGSRNYTRGQKREREIGNRNQEAGTVRKMGQIWQLVENFATEIALRRS